MKGINIMEVYNQNRDKNRNMRDEIREQNAKLKDASFSEKLAYFKEYYLKTTLVVIAIIIFVCSVGYTMITAPDETAFGAYFFNNTAFGSDESLQDSFIEHLGIDTREYEVYIDTTATYSENATYEEYVSIQRCMANIAGGTLDVLVCDQASYEHFATSEIFLDITTVLPEDLMEKFKDKIVYSTIEETQETIPSAIIVTDAPKLQQYHYYDNIDAYFSIVANTQNIDNIISFLRFIYEE